MKDEEKTKKQLIQELDQMRQRVAQLEALEIGHKHTEEALRESEESLRALLNAIQESAFLMDIEGIVLQANEAVARRLGTSVEQFVGSCAYDFVPPEVSKKRKEQATEVIRTGRLVRFEDVRHDRYINNTIYPIFDRAGKVIKMAILGIDITERKQAEKKLDSERRRLFSVLDELPAFVYLQSPDYSIRFANRYFREHFGEPEGKTCYETLWDAKEPCDPCPTFRVFDTKISQEWEWTQPGTDRIYQIYDYPFIDIDGSPLVLEMGFDITERKRAEERIDGLNHLKEELLRPGGLDERLKRITDGVVEIFNADFARIWITKPGDLCNSGCFHARVTEGLHVCRYRDRCLYLMASSGRYTHTNGELHRRVPFDCYKIGRVAAGKDPKFITNDVIHDPRVHDHDWARKLGLVSFAGYRLLSVTGEPIGVLALFSKHVISSEEDALLEGLANTTSQVIQMARADEALAEERNLLRTLIDNLPDYIFVKDVESRFIVNNIAHIRVLRGTTQDELIGKTDFDVFPQELAAQYYAEEKKIIQSGQPLVNREEFTIDPEGRKQWLVTTKVPLRDSQGKIVGLVGICHDITERKRIEEALKARARQQGAVAELGQRALINIDLSILMNEAVVLVGQTLDVEYCKVLKLLPDRDALLLLAGIGWKEGLVGRETVGAGSDSQAGYTLLSHEPVIVEDLRTETRFSGPPLLREHGVVSGISVIIGDQKQPFGILGAHTTRHRIFTQDDIHFLQNIANVLATMIERKQAEDALQRARKERQDIFEAVEHPIVILDPQHAVIAANRAVIKATGKSEDELKGLKCYEIFHEKGATRPPEGCPMEKMLLSGKLETVEMEMEALRGIYLVSCTPVTDQTGQLKKIIHIATNITEHKRAEEALQSEKERAQMYFNIAGVMLLVLDADEKVAQINQKGCEILGYGAEDIIGKNWFNHFLPDSCRERLRRGFKDFVSGKIPRKEDVLITGNENPILRQDGRERTILWNSSPISDPEDKKIVGVLSSGEDITNRRRAEEQLQHYAAELQEVNKELSQYAYVVSHDLKAPLRAIHNYADFLREDLEATLDEEQKAYLDGLDRAVQEANALVEDLLQLSRIGQRSIEVETLEVGSFLHALFSSLDLPADVEIIMGGDWPTLTTEPVLLRQIFQNLINNAVKFNESAKKRIELGWQQVGEEHYEFFVCDNGIGFDLRHQEKIFRVFERLHTKKEFEGTGIGLAIVKKAVGKLGGTVRVESQPGEGSTFFVMLPRTTTNSTTNLE